jgi:trk system potassium uptake protein
VDEDLLLEENIDKVDVFCALTSAEEANILSSFLAKRMGASRVIALINRPSYAKLVEDQYVDIAVSPQEITLSALLAKVRGMRLDVGQVHALRSGAAEAIEAVAHGDKDFQGGRARHRERAAAAGRDHRRDRPRGRGAHGAS